MSARPSSSTPTTPARRSSARASRCRRNSRATSAHLAETVSDGGRPRHRGARLQGRGDQTRAGARRRRPRADRSSATATGWSRRSREAATKSRKRSARRPTTWRGASPRASAISSASSPSSATRCRAGSTSTAPAWSSASRCLASNCANHRRRERSSRDAARRCERASRANALDPRRRARRVAGRIPPSGSPRGCASMSKARGPCSRTPRVSSTPCCPPPTGCARDDFTARGQALHENLTRDLSQTAPQLGEHASAVQERFAAVAVDAVSAIGVQGDRVTETLAERLRAFEQLVLTQGAEIAERVTGHGAHVQSGAVRTDRRLRKPCHGARRRRGEPRRRAWRPGGQRARRATRGVRAIGHDGHARDREPRRRKRATARPGR